MAVTAGQPGSDLTDKTAAPEATDFFELLRRLETAERRFGRGGGPGNEPARLGQRARLAIATRDVAGFRPADGDRPAEVDVEVLGLLGPEGALPLHITRWVLTRLSERWFDDADARAASDTTFLDFCNMLQHRMMALYWRGWADARPEVQVEHGSGGRARAVLATLAGTGMPAMSDPAGLGALYMRHGTSLAMAVHGPERLARLLAEVIGAPIELVEFVGHWLPIPAGLQTRIGRAHAGLGETAVAGARVFRRVGRAELRVGPLTLADYRRFLDDAGLRDRVRQAIRFAVGGGTDFDLRLILRRTEKPDPILGTCQLGRTLWLPSRGGGDAGDLRFAGFAPGPESEAA